MKQRAVRPMRPRHHCCLCCAVLLAVSGCAASPWAASSATAKSGKHVPSASSTVAAAPAGAPGGPPTGSPGGPAAGSGAGQASAEQMQEVLAELQRLGAMDPATRDQLTADLQNTDPALWPGILHQARAVAAYRQQTAQRPEATVAMAAGPHGGLAAASAGPQPYAAPPGQSAYPPLNDHSPLRPPLQGELAGGNVPINASMDRLPVSSSAAIPPQSAPAGPYPATAFQPAVPIAAGPASGGPPETSPLRESLPPVAPNDAPAQAPPRDAGVQTAPASSPSVGDEVADRSPAVPVSYVAEKPLDGPGHIQSAIEMLEKAEKRSPEDEVRLRVLYLAAGQYDNAVRAITELPAGEQAFWTAQFHGLGTLLDTAKNPDTPSRMAESKHVLAEASSKLGELAPLLVRNLAFCTRVHSYGCFETFSTFKFVPEQRVLLYAEVDNFTSESTARGHHTSLRSSYQIFDARGQRIADQELASTEELCQNRRRDFFIVYDFHLPKQIFPGKHTLRLTIEDLKGKKIGDSAIDFEITSETSSQ